MRDLISQQQAGTEPLSQANAPAPDTYRAWILAGVMCCGIIVSLVLSQTLRRQEDRHIREAFINRAADRMKSIASQLNSGMTLVRSVGTYMHLSPEMTQKQFGSIASSLLSRYPAIQALSWNSRVSSDQFDAYVASARTRNPEYQARQLLSDGAIVPIDTQPTEHPEPRDRFIVELIEPLEPNRSALGLDIVSESVRREALYRACDTGRPIASGRIRLVQETGSQFGTLVISPVYRNSAAESEESGRNDVAGVVVGVYRIGDAVEAAMKNLEPAGIDVHLFDESARPGEQQLYQHSSRMRDRPAEIVADPRKHETPVCESMIFEFGGREWALYCTPTTDYFVSRRSWLPLIVLFAGLFFSSLVAAYIYNQSRLTNQLRREIVERTRAERKIAEQQLTLAHISRLSTMGEMMAGIAHEINQPLSAISNYSTAARNLLQTSHQDCEPIEGWLEQISRQAVRCGDIIRGLRRFVSKDDETFELVDLNKVVHDSVALIKTEKRCSARHIECRLPSPGPQMYASEVQLQQVLVNLLRNACDSTHENAVPEICVSIEPRDGIARLTIEDHGSGVDEDQRARLFDAFYTTKSDGLGMGLAISRTIIEAHGGKLWLDSETRVGARFHIELPMPKRPLVNSASCLGADSTDIA